MTMNVNAFVSLLLLLITSALAATINIKAWQSADSNPNQSDYPEVSYLSSKPNTAIAFSGGGARAYVGAIGYLAALNQLDLIKNVRYIGGISGGSWATMTYVFNQLKVNDDVFLGDITYPEDITTDILQSMDSQCARGFASADLTIIGLQAFKDGIVSTIPDAWAYGIYKTYLEPAGIPDNTLFSWNSKTVSEIKLRNSVFKSTEFVTPTSTDKPFSVIGTTVVGPVSGGPYKSDTQNYTMLEITPLYIGQLKTQDVTYKYNLGLKHVKTVGGAIELIGACKTCTNSPTFGLSSGSTEGTLQLDQPTDILDIKLAASLSSYAPGALFESLVSNLSVPLGLSINYWSPTNKLLLNSGELTYFADGGSYENINLISFIQRRVEKVVLFFVSSTPLQPSSNWNVTENIEYDNQISDCLSAFFGVVESTQADWQNKSYEYEKDQIFDTSDYIEVINGLQQAQSDGNGIIYTTNLTTVENDWWGIPSGITTQITFVYLGRVLNWENSLSDEMKALLIPSENSDDLSVDVSSGPFRGFPHYLTTGGAINYERANVLADLTGWTILKNEELFRDILS
eukprot:gene19173-25018_t